MSNSLEFFLYSLIWIFSFFLFVYIVKKLKFNNIGLGLIYFFNFSIVHFWGSVFFILPNYWNEGIELTLLGYRYSTIGIVSYFLGYIFYIKFVSRNGNIRKIKSKKYLGNEPLLYFLIGIVIFFVLRSRLQGLPTVTVFVSMGQQLMIVGLCLLLYKTYILRKYISFFSLLIFSALIPFITILSHGFLGTGLSMFITVLIFMSNFYRFNFRYLLIFLFAIYLGLSFYQSYLRDRHEIRDLVWGGAVYSQRIDQLLYTVTNLTLFNPFNTEQLDRVDDRLNQNRIIGASVDYMSNGNIEYEKGRTFKTGIINLVPRIIWKNKPIKAGDTSRVEKYTGLKFQSNTSVGMPHVMELYVNFAIFSVVIGFILIGFIFSYMDNKSYITLHNYQFNKFVLYFLPALAFMRTETPFIDNISAGVAGGIIAYGLQKLPKQYNSLLFFIITFLIVLFIVKKYYLPLVENLI